MSTVAVLSDVAICNFAAHLLDDMHLTSLDEGGSFARFCAAEYGFVRDELLSKYPWAFALAYSVCSPSSPPPAFGWTYRYELPTDCMRLLPPTVGGRPEGAPIRYKKVGRAVYTTYGPALYICFVQRVTSAALFDPLFARLLGTELALLAATRVTGKAVYYDKVKDARDRALVEARSTDSLVRGTPEVEPLGEVHLVRSCGLRGLGR